MAITVKFFALGRELTGRDQITLDVSEGETVELLRKKLQTLFPDLSRLGTYLIAVNLEYQDGQTRLSDGDEIAIIPPVSGG